MESCILNQQRIIQTPSYILRTMQFVRDIPENDEQYFPRVTV